MATTTTTTTTAPTSTLPAIDTTLEQKEARFLSAPKFAVVGASTTSTKNGFKALKWLVDHNKDVVPVNPNATEIQNIRCLKTLSELPDPTHTAISIVVPPQVTLEILKEAKELGVFAIWLQPGAEDDAVVKMIEDDALLAERCVYRHKALHNLPGLVMAAITLHEDTVGPCLFKDPSTVTTPVTTQTAPISAAA
ncbi:CoA binding domain-containing protein [Roridomyces roridus]|uniref:CoA binding domain-containing protein n=1 Tax=Roridomyces roridus TaxID=1738132 RepID=A0AAD7FYB8_9AGAR|nr:CoA binding domain-containing protein [Roridomyces roridus]